jgi:predicted RNA-binding protein with PUA-like domain
MSAAKSPPARWLVKTEPETYSIDDLARERRTRWEGVRNYQARNLMRDSMRVGDEVIVYHSNAEPPAAVGLARVSRPAAADATALERGSDHFDPKATAIAPIWVCVELEFVERFARPVPLAEIRATPGLEGLPLLQRGQRLSVQPVGEREFAILVRLGRSAGKSPPATPKKAAAGRKAARRR